MSSGSERPKAPSSAGAEGARGRPRETPRWISIGRLVAISFFTGMIALASYGTLVPATPRCELPGSVGCPGGVLGPVTPAAGLLTQWFDVTMYDWGFWIVDSTTGANESATWTIFEGYTVNINATSLPPDTAIGGSAYHGLGIELNATGQQLLSLAAPVGQWVSASFVAPTTPYYHQHIWCTIQCGPGHGSQQAHNLNIVQAVPLPLAAVTANVTLGPAPLMVGLTGAGSSGTSPYNLSWSFGDGSAGTYGTSVHHTYTLGGVYDATLTVTDAKGYQAQASTTITVLSNAAINASMRAAPAVGAAPFATTFSVLPHGGTPPYRYDWSFGDGSGGNGASLSQHVFTSPGVYAAVVNVTDTTGAYARAIASVTVDAASGSLAVNVTATPPSGNPPLLTVFSAGVGIGGIPPYLYAWNFGDGGTAAGRNVSHVFNQTGYYNVVVFVTDSAGHAGHAVVGVPITVPSYGGGGGGGGGGDNLPAPRATFLTVRMLADPSGGPPPLAVEVIASVENGTGMNENATWSFGDGSAVGGLVVTHLYAVPGSYTIQVTVLDSGGYVGVGSTMVAVGGPAISVVGNRTAGDTPLDVAAGVTLTGGSGAWNAASWDWGDGTTSTGMLVAHQYSLNDSGTYWVQVSATDAGGNRVSAATEFYLTGPPVATVAISLPPGHSLPALVAFLLNVTGGTGGYPRDALWSFGDLTSTRGPASESHSYNRTGHYHVVVETNDSAGRYAIASGWVNLSSAVNLPPPRGGGSGWVFKGVEDPSTVSFLLLGLVGVTGLAFLVRKRRRQARRAAARSAPAPRPVNPPTRGLRVR